MVIFYGICVECGCDNKILSYKQLCQDCSINLKEESCECHITNGCKIQGNNCSSFHGIQYKEKQQ